MDIELAKSTKSSQWTTKTWNTLLYNDSLYLCASFVSASICVYQRACQVHLALIDYTALLIFIFVVSLSALLFSNLIKEKRGKTRKQEESSETLHSQIKEFLDLNCNYCSRLLTSTALVQKNNVFRILPARHLFSSLAVQHLHLQSARTLLIFNETARKEGFWYIFDAFVFTSMLFVCYFCMYAFVNWKIRKFPNSVGDFYETSKTNNILFNHFIISFHEPCAAAVFCCFFSFFRPSKIWGQTRQAEKAPVFCSAGKATATSGVSKEFSKKNPLTNWKSWMFFGKFFGKNMKPTKREYLMTISTYMDYILDAYCMQWTNGLEVSSKKNERNNYIL